MIREAAIGEFGEAFVAALERTAGCHSREYGQAPGADRLVFGLLEALDFDCPNYGWDCPQRWGSVAALSGVSREQVKRFLLTHREAVLASRCPLPSALGLLSGTFDFLRAAEEGGGEGGGEG